MKLNEVYRSDERYDKMGAAQRIVDWYDEVYDMGGQQQSQIDELLGAHEISGSDPERMFHKLLTLHPQDLNKLVRGVQQVMGRR